MWTCKPQNGGPGGGDMSGGKLDRFCAFRGLGAVPIQLVTNSGGGMLQESALGCYKPHLAISLPGSHLAVVDRPASDDTAGTSRTIATPHFFPLYRQAGVGVCYRVCYKPCPPLWGSLSSNLSLREGFGHRPQAGADAPEENPMKWRYPVLIFGGLCCSAWGFIYRPFP